MGASTTDFVTYYSHPHRRRAGLIAGLHLVPFSAIAFIWFMAALRARYVASVIPENPLLSTVQLVAGALLVIALLMVGAIELALVWDAEASGSLVPHRCAVQIGSRATATRHGRWWRSGPR